MNTQTEAERIQALRDKIRDEWHAGLDGDYDSEPERDDDGPD